MAEVLLSVVKALLGQLTSLAVAVFALINGLSNQLTKKLQENRTIFQAVGDTDEDRGMLGGDSDSLTSITYEYDVFLSFRGIDARYGIVDHLYERMIEAGLRVFKDEEEIHRGEEIGAELKRAIHSSRVYAVVFSRNYASSAWCLRELDMMVNLRGGSKVSGEKIILPIFYGAAPADLKLRTELYREALDKHKGRHGRHIVKKWEEALKTVGGISGWDSRVIPGEGRFVRLIVQDIMVKLRIKDQSVPVHLTGIDDRVTKMLNLLDYDSTGVRLVVLHGMGGIGKTTLARIVFNKLSSQFEWSSFISNVRESSSSHGGIRKLQNQLLRDIHGGQYARSCNSDDDFGDIVPRIRCKRMLLVLDDVDELTQLHKLVGNNPESTLGTGSRVIITTRDRSVCNGFVRSGTEILHFYEMEKMSENHALQLFSRHAFGTDEPAEGYLSLSKQVIETTGNLPLALEVIAGHLCCHSKETWMCEIQKLKNVPLKKVSEILKVSFEGLEFGEREIFLDIVCFPLEMPRRYADFLWEDRKLYPEAAVKVLINKSLIKIDSNGEFWIHDQLRDMGREIIKSESDGRPKRYTRLTNPDDALNIVLNKQVSERTIAMNLGRHDEAHKFSDENFSGLSNLLFLHLNGTKLTGDFGNLRESLMWLFWDGCNKRLSSDFFKMNSLVVLRIVGIKGGWKSVVKLMMPKLRVLEVRRSDMTTSPDLSCCLKLQIMVFEQCFKLKEIHHSVGKLDSLTHMEISQCPSLRSLPNELCGARALRELIATFSRIEEVPESIGRLKSLRTLNLSHNKIRRLPLSIRDLKNLLVLDAASNPLDEGIPEEIWSLSALEDLVLSFSRIRFLPATVSRISSLKSLILHDCDMLQELPGLPTSLTTLTFSTKLLRGVPNLDVLTNITELKLSDGMDCIKDYEGERLELSGLGSLHKLKSLVLCPSRMITFNRASVLGSLSGLETLVLSLPVMTSVPELPSSLRKLTLRDTRTSVPWESYSNLRLLTELEIVNSTLTDIDLGGLDLLPSLTTLSIGFSDSLVRVSNIGRLRGVKSITFTGCAALVEIPGLEQLEMLENLTIWYCHSIRGIQDLLGLKRLKSAFIYDCSPWLCVPRVIDECHLIIRLCGKLRSFEGTYSEYERQSKFKWRRSRGMR